MKTITDIQIKRRAAWEARIIYIITIFGAFMAGVWFAAMYIADFIVGGK